MPLRSNGSLPMSRVLMAAGLVDRLQLTIFPVIGVLVRDDRVPRRYRRLRGSTLVEARTQDGHT